MTPKILRSWFTLTFVIYVGLIVITAGTSVQDDSPVCKPFNESSGWKEFCGYDSTASFIKSDSVDFKKVAKTQLLKLKAGKCADIIKLLECSIWFPRCVQEVRGPFLPCRRVCHHAVYKCGEELRNLSQMLFWDIKLHCDMLPEKNQPGTANFRRRCFEPPNFETDLQKGVIEPRKCFPIHVSLCKNLSYNYTFIPKESQMDVWSPHLKYILKESNKTLCNDLRKQLFCGYFVTPCYADIIVRPCQQTCQRYYRNKCEMKWLTFAKNCGNLPQGSSPVGYCTVHDWHYAKSWPAAYVIEAKRSGGNRSLQPGAITLSAGLLIISARMIFME